MGAGRSLILVDGRPIGRTDFRFGTVSRLREKQKTPVRKVALEKII